jgi:hypothetical protein
MTEDSFLTPPQLAKRLRVAPETVLGWIRSGELVAANLAARNRRRPRYHIDPRDVEEFLKGRRPKPKSEIKRPPKRQMPEGMIRYYGGSTAENTKARM